MVNLPVFQIVGYQNSGKTTFINKVIQMLTQDDIKVATIKHHGHGGKPELDEKKDSASYIQSGAKVSLVEGHGRIILQAEKKNWTLLEQISILTPFQLDLILIEGHKYEELPKAVILNNEEDLILVNELSNMKVVFFRNVQVRDKLKKTLFVPYYHIDDHEGIEWLVNYLKSQLKKQLNK